VNERLNATRSVLIFSRAACNMGLESLVSKLRDRAYQHGRSKYWIKIKNRKHPAMDRVMEALS
jgi:bifunctional non-homologous end joining protein LigD